MKCRPVLMFTAALIVCALASPFCDAQDLPPAATQARASEVLPADSRRGKASYGDACAMCHGQDLNGGTGPALKGSPFELHWKDQSPDARFAYIIAKMPPSQPGTLSSQTYVDIEAYILQNNADGFFMTKQGSGASNAGAANAGPKLPAFASHGGPPNEDAIFNSTVVRRTQQLSQISPVTDATLRNPAAADWLGWRDR